MLASHSKSTAALLWSVAGRATCFQGRLQVQVGSSWGKVEKLTGEELQQAPPYCAAHDISAARRSYGALLLRQQQSQLLAYILPADTQQAAGAAAQVHYCPVPCVTAAYDEPQRMAASRWGCSYLVAAGALPLGVLHDAMLLACGGQSEEYCAQPASISQLAWPTGD